MATSDMRNTMTKTTYLFRSTKIVYKVLGKETYQPEVSNKIKVPNRWKKMSGTSVSCSKDAYRLILAYTSLEAIDASLLCTDGKGS